MNKKAVYIISIIGFIVVAFGIIAIPNILIDEKLQNDIYWKKIYWLIFLNFIFWVYFGLSITKFTKDKNSIYARINIIISPLFLLYISISAIIILINLTNNETKFITSLQIFIFVFFAVLILFVNIIPFINKSSEDEYTDLKDYKNKVLSYINMVSVNDIALMKKIDLLKSSIEFSIPNKTVNNKAKIYMDLIIEIEQTLEKLSNPNTDDSLINEISLLSKKIKMV